jgi:hypothetical protein
MRKLLEHSTQLDGQRTQQLADSEPPLVTEQSIEEARKMNFGKKFWKSHI